MNYELSADDKGSELHDRRSFLRSIGKWSGAAVGVGGWIGSSPDAKAGWVNRRGVVRGGWINGGGWVNRAGGWINGGGGGGWINRRGAAAVGLIAGRQIFGARHA
jgi:hypothetical protein